MSKSTKIKKVQQRKVAAQLRMEKRKAAKLKYQSMETLDFSDSYDCLSYEDLNNLLGLPTRMVGKLD